MENKYWKIEFGKESAEEVRQECLVKINDIKKVIDIKCLEYIETFLRMIDIKE